MRWSFKDGTEAETISVVGSVEGNERHNSNGDNIGG